MYEQIRNEKTGNRQTDLKKRVAACHDANNPKSGRVMEKAGMKFEGVLRQS